MRRDAEEFAKESLASRDLDYQNRLVNIKSMEVYSMSILGMYSFLLIAPHAFRSAWNLYCTTIGIASSAGDVVENAWIYSRTSRSLSLELSIIRRHALTDCKPYKSLTRPGE